MKSNTNNGPRRRLAGLAFFLASTGAYAQATRAWVSGVGDDVNPCSRTAPCKNFAGAISKTAAGGIISVLDPGSYGMVTITKSLTIDGGGWFEASILASGASGVVVNAAGINLVLRNLRISGGTAVSPGVNGVRFLYGASPRIENCHISYFRDATAGNGNGVMVDASAAGTYRLFILNSTIVSNGVGNDGGVRLRPTGASTFVFADIRNSGISNNNGCGVLSRDRTFVTVTGSNISGNTRSGVNPTTTGTTGETVVSDSTLTDNASVNVGSEAGVLANGAASFIHIAGNSISQSESALRRLNSGHINSAGDNRSLGNTTDGTTDGTVTSL